MQLVKQEITFDSTYLSELGIKLGKLFIEDSDLREKYYRLISTLKEFHLLCIDTSNQSSESKWLADFKNLLKELEKFDEYQYGSIISELLVEDILEYFIHGGGIIPKSYLVKNDIKDYNLEIARSSLFKLLLTNRSSPQSEVVKVTFDDFTGNYNNKDSILLRPTRYINFENNNEILNFNFLSPYLYFADALKIWDKYLLKDLNHRYFLLELLGLMADPREITIYTNFEKSDPVVEKIKDEIYTRYDNIKILIKYLKDAHPRRIETDYSTIESTNTFDILDFQSGKWFVRKSIMFTCTIC